MSFAYHAGFEFKCMYFYTATCSLPGYMHQAGLTTFQKTLAWAHTFFLGARSGSPPQRLGLSFYDFFKLEVNKLFTAPSQVL